MTETELLIFIGTAALKGTVILGIAGLVNVSWRSASAASRHLVWTIGVTAALALPIISGVIQRANVPRIEIAAWPDALREAAPLDLPVAMTNVNSASSDNSPEFSFDGEESSESPSSISFSVGTNDAPAEETPAAVVAAAVPPTQKRDIQRDLLFIWIAGMAACFLPLLVAFARVRAVVRNAREVKEGRWHDLVASTPAIAHMNGSVRVLESDRTTMPMTWGIKRPTLLVPSHGSEWPDWKCRDILLHELAHVERRDCTTQLLAHVACAVYWFNPLMWVAAHRMRVERELACDDRVLSAGSRASDYAANLLDVARSLRSPSFTSPSAIAMARPSQLSGRLLAVLDTGRNRRSVTRRIAAATCFTAAAIVLPLAALTQAADVAAASETVDAVTVEQSVANTAGAKRAPLLAAFPVLSNAIVRASQLPAVGLVGQQTPEQSLAPLSPISSHVSLTLPAFTAAPCWTGGDGHNSVSMSNSDEKNGRPSWHVRYSNDDCAMELWAEGTFTLRSDLSDLESISNDGWFRVEERQGRSSKRVEIRRADNGSLDHQYWVNGDRKPYDADAKSWLATMLLSVERRTAFAAKTRVPQLYKSGGLNSVLNEIGQMETAYPKAQYYGTVLDMGVQLDNGTLNNLVTRASSDLASSDYYMSEVLKRFGSQPAANEATWRIFAGAAGKMKSDYYKSETLKRVLKSGHLSAPTVGLLLNSAASIKSDYYLTDLLKGVAGQYALNGDTRQYYVNALKQVDSDYYRTELLRAMGTNDDSWDSKTSAYVLSSVGDIKSDYYKYESLASLVKAKHVDSWPQYFEAASSIGSDYYKKEALTAALKQEPLTRDVVSGVLSAAAKMKSDSEMSDVLTNVARRYKIDDSLRSAYEKAVDAMESDYYRGSALSALRRSMSR
jgi:beta-lactamase regulating signal transducer with metallopeptidase domain